MIELERPEFLHDACHRVFLGFKSAGLAPAREAMQRPGIENDELVERIKEIWSELARCRPCDFPWSPTHTTLSYIKLRKRMTRNGSSRPIAAEESLFPSPSGHVYFMTEGGDTEFVKIGFSSQEPGERAREMQTGNPRELSLAAWIPGTRDTERALHIRFASDRVRLNAEWFVFSDEIKEYIQKHCNGW